MTEEEDKLTPILAHCRMLGYTMADYDLLIGTLKTISFSNGAYSHTRQNSPGLWTSSTHTWTLYT